MTEPSTEYRGLCRIGGCIMRDGDPCPYNPYRIKEENNDN